VHTPDGLGVDVLLAERADTSMGILLPTMAAIVLFSLGRPRKPSERILVALVGWYALPTSSGTAERVGG